MVGDGTWLKLSEVIARLARYPGYNRDRIRDLADAGYLLTVRPPSVGPGTTHRRFEAASVDMLEKALRLPQEEQAAALDALRARNRPKVDKVDDRVQDAEQPRPPRPPEESNVRTDDSPLA